MITMAEYQRVAKDPLKKFVLTNLLRYSDLMGLIPWTPVDQLSAVVTRWKTLPSVGFRQIGGGYSESTGTTEQVTEGVYALGGDVEYDRVFEMVKNNIKDPKQLQMEMKVKAIAYAFNDAFINGDHATNVDSFEGLNKRIASYLPARQSLSLGTAFDANASADNRNKFLDYMHEALDLAGLRKAPMVKVGKGNGQPARSGAILMNRATYLGIAKILRRSGYLATTVDAFGREFDSFNGVPLIDAGLKPDQSTEIITDAYGASNNETRLYFVRFGSDANEGMVGIQLTTPEPYDPLGGSEKEAGPQKLMRIDWFAGLAGFGSYYASRLTGLLKTSSWTGA